MNITLLVNRDLPANYALNLLLPALSEHRLTVFLSSKVGGKKRSVPRELEELAFVEQKLFNQLVFPLLHQIPLKKGGTSLKSFEALGAQLAQPIEELNDINKSRGLERLKASAPDLVLSIRFGVILRSAAISVPRLGVLNLHSGLLPEYRGVMATFHALLNGAEQLGTTVHFIPDRGIDTGPVLGQTTLQVKPGGSYLHHVLNLYPEGCALLAQTAQRLLAGQAVDSRAQSEGGAYYTFPTQDELARFHALGHRLFDSDEWLAFARRYVD